MVQVALPVAGLLGAGGILILIVIITWVLAIVALARTRRLERRLERWLKLTGSPDLEELLAHHAEALSAASSRLAALEEEASGIQNRLRTAVRGVGTVRFDAFGESGSALSFAVALLDARGNGVVVTAIHGRGESRVYAKPVEAGESQFLTSSEEKEAIRLARQAVD